MRCHLFRHFLVIVLLLFSKTVSAIDCSNCGNALSCLRPGQLYCPSCGQMIYPGDLFNPRRGVSAISEETLVVSQDGSNLDATNQVMLHAGGLFQFNPTQIISNQNLNHLLSYMNCHYYVLQNPYIVFSAISLAQLLILNVPALATFDEADQQGALWWLIGYWLLYMSPGTRNLAQEFLSQAPASLQLDQAQSHIQSLQGDAAAILELPHVMTLFHDQAGHHYNFSTAQATLNSLGSHFYLAQVTYPGGIIAVIQLAGTYYIITPYNQLFTTTSQVTALQILSQIATTQYLPRRMLMIAIETFILTGIGAGVGGITGLPLLGLSLLGGATSGQALTSYGVWISISIATINLAYNRLGARRKIINDLNRPPQDQDQDQDQD